METKEIIKDHTSTKDDSPSSTFQNKFFSNYSSLIAFRNLSIVLSCMLVIFSIVMIYFVYTLNKKVESLANVATEKTLEMSKVIESYKEFSKTLQISEIDDSSLDSNSPDFATKDNENSDLPAKETTSEVDHSPEYPPLSSIEKGVLMCQFFTNRLIEVPEMISSINRE